MCGRYVLYGPHSRYREKFDAEGDLDLAPRYNVTPSQTLPVVVRSPEGPRRFVLAQWGLVPSWVKDPAERHKPINARAETAAILPMFRSAFRKSRVLVPADGFYEWQAVGGKKEPYLIRMRNQSPFGMAGLLEHWQGSQGEIRSFTLLTTEPNPLMAQIHNRMPAIIRPEDYETWLDPAVANVEVLQGLLAPYPERFMEAFRVGRTVNNPANDGPDLLLPISEDTT
jgi:putative SOS response-associated peptidase YedK